MTSIVFAISFKLHHFKEVEMEEGGHWVVWKKELTEDEVRRRYFKFG
jgi:hypothetical protein